VRFLELALPFIPDGQKATVEAMIQAGGDAMPDGFSKLAERHMELFGLLRRTGKLSAYYETLKRAFSADPDDLDLLRILAAAASIPSLDKADDFERWLRELMKRDGREDVAWPLANVLTRKGDPQAALDILLQSAGAHPEQAAGLLATSLRLFAERDAPGQLSAAVTRLKSEPNLSALFAEIAGGTLMAAERYQDADYFYTLGIANADEPYLKEVCQVKHCRIQTMTGTQNEETVAALRELAQSALLPNVQKEARRMLVSLNPDLIPDQPDNTNP
jgi:hypothetical protein